MNNIHLIKEYIKLVLSESDSYPFVVGDNIIAADGSDYRGKITYISKDENVVKHVDIRTGKESKKSYYGFPVRYKKAK